MNKIAAVEIHIHIQYECIHLVWLRVYVKEVDERIGIHSVIIQQMGGHNRPPVNIQYSGIPFNSRTNGSLHTF